MSYTEMPPALGEMPNTFFGGIETDGVLGEIETGVIGEYPIGPVRECGVAEQPTVIGEVNIPPCMGNTGMPGCVGTIETGP